MQKAISTKFFTSVLLLIILMQKQQLRNFDFFHAKIHPFHINLLYTRKLLTDTANSYSLLAADDFKINECMSLEVDLA